MNRVRNTEDTETSSLPLIMLEAENCKHFEGFHSWNDLYFGDILQQERQKKHNKGPIQNLSQCDLSEYCTLKAICPKHKQSWQHKKPLTEQTLQTFSRRRTLKWKTSAGVIRQQTADWLKIGVVFLQFAACSLPHNQIQTAHLHSCKLTWKSDTKRHYLSFIKYLIKKNLKQDT